jgi:hypothetical protein
MHQNSNRRGYCGWLGLFVLVAGCGGVDTEQPQESSASNDEAAQALTFSQSHWWRHGPRTGGTFGQGGSGTSGGSPSTTGGQTGTTGGEPGTTGGQTGATLSCAVCSKANTCCKESSGGPLCTYDPSTCAELAPAAQAAYINACLTLLDTVRSVRTAAAPSSCH